MAWNYDLKNKKEVELPSYVDDVFAFIEKKDFPEVGKIGCLYVEYNPLKRISKVYRWNGNEYILLMIPSDEKNNKEPQKKKKKFFNGTCPHCGASSFTLYGDFFKCDYCDSMFDYNNIE